jgi:hypothetical protein
MLSQMPWGCPGGADRGWIWLVHKKHWPGKWQVHFHWESWRGSSYTFLAESSQSTFCVSLHYFVTSCWLVMYPLNNKLESNKVNSKHLFITIWEESYFVHLNYNWKLPNFAISVHSNTGYMIHMVRRCMHNKIWKRKRLLPGSKTTGKTFGFPKYWKFLPVAIVSYFALTLCRIFPVRTSTYTNATTGQLQPEMFAKCTNLYAIDLMWALLHTSDTVG